MRLSRKLITGYLAIAVITVMVGLFGIGSLLKVNDTYNNFTNYHFPVYEVLDDLKFFGMRIVASTSELLVVIDEGGHARQKGEELDSEAKDGEGSLINEGVASFYAAYERYLALQKMYSLSDPEEENVLKSYGEKLLALSSGLISAKQNGVHGEKILEMKEYFEQVERSFLEYVGKLKEKHLLGIEQKIIEVKNFHTRIFYLVIALGGFSLFFAVAFGVIQARAIAGNIQKLVVKADLIGRGETGLPLVINSRDEFGDLASSFNQMENNLHSMADERLQARENLEQYTARLKRNSEELQEFIFIASHDLQEPLRKITTFCEMIRTGAENGSVGDKDGYLDRLSVSAGRMRELLDDLLEYNRIINREPDLRKVNLNELMVTIYSELNDKIESLEAKVDFDWLPEINADEMQLQILLRQLIDNGLKFRRPGVPPVLEIRCVLVDEQWELTVRDNGCGFDQRYMDRIFGVFQKLHAPGVHEGTGMGLALCRKIAENHRGEIKVESEIGAGSVFTVILPVKLD
ncbi:MAG: HAMP domain-containing protein [Proteobacteria bacterium]|nr:HAMP domain-containing protein [Pseudomonadota bacterium]MBU1715960.1 HAMP domain-containing protein [Pseudomonadota bacterium]